MGCVLFLWTAFWLRILPIVLLVVYEILTGEFLNSFVMNVVSFRIYVNDANLFFLRFLVLLCVCFY